MRFSSPILLCLSGFLFLFSNCGKENVTDNEELLSEYIVKIENLSVVEDSLIACAVGGQIGFMENEEFPISILFYPKENPSDFQYFESDTVAINPDDFSQYNRQDLADSPIFNGYLRKFDRPALNKNLWGRVTYIRNGNLYISNAIRLKFDDKPTEYNPSLLTIDQTDDKSPIFTWKDGRSTENEIYFHALLDANNDLVSGTYTFDKRFQFYDLSNVVLNIRDVNPAPILESNATYKLVIMGVSIDNWVNLILDTTFETGE